MSEPVWPTASYRDTLGKLLYTVAAAESLILGDLEWLGVPEEERDNLSDIPTYNIGERIAGRRFGEYVDGPDAIERLEADGGSLRELSKLRNAVVHAHPSKVDNQEVLVRRALSKDPHTVWTQEALDERLEEIIAIYDEMQQRRGRFWDARGGLPDSVERTGAG